VAPLQSNDIAALVAKTVELATARACEQVRREGSVKAYDAAREAAIAFEKGESRRAPPPKSHRRFTGDSK
jgi:hypothetical protein